MVKQRAMKKDEEGFTGGRTKTWRRSTQLAVEDVDSMSGRSMCKVG